MPIQWREQFSVGNDLIDSDHRYLLEIINKAELCLKANQATLLPPLLDELGHYGQMHFQREEQVAKAVGYPKSEQLHISHDALVEKLKVVRSQIGDAWTKESVTHFTAFLRDWLLNHVIKEDMLMKPWLQKYSPRFDPR
ncbi:hemerythrin family protein [Rhodoferax sp.]|uniref:bacteriohemerythrin n=1 Tax=Rhodoferax sp. TaxID=50421 RepID=UPI00283C5483|nr:hemerythrin family protein [Rhodoferax sp.]MDR3368395.1 hemerythrin family protein [Rhodoferax sp.]